MASLSVLIMIPQLICSRWSFSQLLTKPFYRIFTSGFEQGLEVMPNKYDILLRITIIVCVLIFIGLALNDTIKIIKERRIRKEAELAKAYWERQKKTEKKVKITDLVERGTLTRIDRDDTGKLTLTIIRHKSKPKPFLEPKLTKAIKRIVTNSH